MITKLLDIKYPIIQGAMAKIADFNLASSVSNAGGLGIIASGSLTKEELLTQIEKCRSLTSKPFGVNLMLMMPNIDELVDVVVESGVKIVTTGAGSPKKYIKKLKENNIIVIPVIANPKQAIKMEELGADAVIAEGTEAGGHIGKIGTFALVQSVLSSVSIPVVAAGGVSSGKALASILLLGCSGAQIGTRFLLSTDCKIHNNYKKVIKEAKETIVTGNIKGSPVRCIKNKMTEEYLEKEKTDISEEELEKITLGSLKKAAVDGDTKNGSVMSGDIVYLVNKEMTTKEIIEEIINEKNETLVSASKLMKE